MFAFLLNHVTSQFLCGVLDVTLVPCFGLASLCSVMLSSDNGNCERNCCERIIEGGFIEDWINVRYCFVPRLI